MNGFSAVRSMAALNPMQQAVSEQMPSLQQMGSNSLQQIALQSLHSNPGNVITPTAMTPSAMSPTAGGVLSWNQQTAAAAVASPRTASGPTGSVMPFGRNQPVRNPYALTTSMQSMQSMVPNATTAAQSTSAAQNQGNGALAHFGRKSGLNPYIPTRSLSKSSSLNGAQLPRRNMVTVSAPQFGDPSSIIRVVSLNVMPKNGDFKSVSTFQSLKYSQYSNV